MTELYMKSGDGYRVATPSKICEAASAYLFKKITKESPKIESPREAGEFLKNQAGLNHEQFGIVFLDNRHRVVEVKIMFKGSIDSAMVHPREVVREALDLNAAAVVLFHNHPSGGCEPSMADIKITKMLKEALALFDIRIIDHLLVAGVKCVSFAERGAL